ncbi:N-acyl-D-amino-acid deacylase family protein [Embleya hyalina]|uniref:N-acyl-D-amino-acid deacylase n=1 Tax=Embleya hyalina TaxID=516124 RepID=A0A401Z1G0_9ACTN|nr:amidohydrolase family protein [Embleya hyalina]GCE00662.1 N-acyl-D-amino-acid deacylase [Embleya hyalina]
MSSDFVVRGGLLADGTGAPLRRADVLVRGDRIVSVGEVPDSDVAELDAEGAVVAPGFVNVLSQAYESLQRDPRGLSDLYQGVTTEVFGEGYSLGPVEGRMRAIAKDYAEQTHVRHEWPRINDYLNHMATSGVGPNLASFVGADNLRMAFAGQEDRPLTAGELTAACGLLDEELANGALGLGSALIYAPGMYASTEELTAFAEVLARHDALYISHIRNESDALLESLDELITIAERSGARAEVYHLKAAGRDNWPSMAPAIARIEEARARGLAITADIYPYEAGATGLDACIPPRFHDGGPDALRGKLMCEDFRTAVKDAIRAPGTDWDNCYLSAGGADGILLLGGDTSEWNGMTLAQVATRHGDADPLDTLVDIVVADSRMIIALFEMTEDNVRLALQSPWVSVCSDSEAWTAAPPYSDSPTHPRAYGSFARVLGPYVREGVLHLEDAVRRMTSLPARTLRLADRGVIREGAFADLAIFEPDKVRDLATYSDPHRYAEGMRHVVVNGVVAFREGGPTDDLGGRALRRGSK